MLEVEVSYCLSNTALSYLRSAELVGMEGTWLVVAVAEPQNVVYICSRGCFPTML